MLFSSFVEHGLLDELCLTIAPILVGGQAERIATGPGQVLTAMRCAHILTDDDGYLYTRYVRKARLDPDRSTNRYCGRHEQARRMHHVADRGDRVAGRLRARVWPPTRASPPTPAPGRRASRRSRPPRPGRRRSPSRRTTCPGTTARRRNSATPAVPAAGRRQAGLRELRRRPRPGQRRGRDAEHRRGARQIGEDARRRRTAGVHHRLGPAVVAAAAGLAGARRRRRARQAPDRRDRPSRHGQLEPGGLPRAVRPPGDPRPGAVRVRQRPGRQPRATSCTTPPPAAPTPSRPATPPTTTPTPRPTSNGCAASGTCRAGADRHRQRRPGGAVVRQRAPRQGRPAGPRLPAGVGRRRRSRRRAAGQRPAGGAGRVRRPMRRGELPAGARSRRPRSSGILADARAGHGPAGASVASIVNAISTALGYPTGDRVGTTNELATALATARTGDTNLLANLINRAQSTRSTDGQFVNSCSDAVNRPTPDRIRELVVAWAQALPAVRHRRRAQPGQVRLVAEQYAPAAAEKPRRSTCC